ncbi:hypothetical protein LEP3755_25950 [Leptolyngbya sp. NIES-3755]|nr:hypothetical protein LEP3755_25950 [Leptolyngbya sp. NIES-3755]
MRLHKPVKYEFQQMIYDELRHFGFVLWFHLSLSFKI